MAAESTMSTVFQNSFAAQRYTLHQSKDFDVARPILFEVSGQKKLPVSAAAWLLDQCFRRHLNCRLLRRIKIVPLQMASVSVCCVVPPPTQHSNSVNSLMRLYRTISASESKSRQSMVTAWQTQELSLAQIHSEPNCHNSEKKLRASDHTNFKNLQNSWCEVFLICLVNRVHCFLCAVEFERVAEVAHQQDMQTLTIIPTDALHRDSELSSIINHAASAADLHERGFLTGVLMLVAQAPMQRIFEHDLFDKLTEMDPLLRRDVHPQLGPWKDLLRSLVKRGYLHTSKEMTSTASADNKSVTAYRFGANARAHVGISGISCALKEIESGFTTKSGEALDAVGNKVIKAWYGMEQLRNKNPLRDSKGQSRGQKRSRS